ncbi:UNVERIFIED_CONTAM: hypothetical protein HDU68_006644, partial [Siphonaria sp. JEL0065]
QKPDLTVADLIHFVRIDFGQKLKHLDPTKIQPSHLQNYTGTAKVIVVVNSFSLAKAPDFAHEVLHLLNNPETDRAGAAKNQQIKDLAARLEAMHGTTYQASSIHWQMYATYCFDKFDKLEELVTKYLKYFFKHNL